MISDKEKHQILSEHLSLITDHPPMRYVENPPNPWQETHVEWIGEPPESRVEVFEETETW